MRISDWSSDVCSSDLLVLFFLQGALGLGLRRLFKTTAIRDCKTVILYGHKLNGNLLALYRAMEADYRHQLRPVFVPMDPAYHRTLKAEGIRSQWACGIDCAGRKSVVKGKRGLVRVELGGRRID